MAPKVIGLPVALLVGVPAAVAGVPPDVVLVVPELLELPQAAPTKATAKRTGVIPATFDFIVVPHPFVRLHASGSDAGEALRITQWRSAPAPMRSLYSL